MGQWSRQTRAAVTVTVLSLFAAYRWIMRAEPLNADDLTLFQISAEAANGRHFLWQSPPFAAFLHHHFRLGLLPFAVPAIWLFGPTHLAYYLAPLFYSLSGFALVWYVMHVHINPGFALAFALVHLTLPFEVADSCRFLIDVPAAIAAVLSLVLLDDMAPSAPGTQVRLAGRGSVIGFVLFEAYLLRENQLLLLAPALLLFLWESRTRNLTLWALGVLGGGLCSNTCCII
jgi:hypothetical protein